MLKHDLHGFVVDNGRDHHHPVDLPLPEHRALAGDSLLTGGGFPPTSLAQFPSSLPAPPRVSNLLPPPPRVGSQSAGIESRGRDGAGGSVLHDRAVASAQESRLMHNLVMGDGRLPPRQSQCSTRDHHTDRPSSAAAVDRRTVASVAALSLISGGTGGTLIAIAAIHRGIISVLPTNRRRTTMNWKETINGRWMPGVLTSYQMMTVHCQRRLNCTISRSHTLATTNMLMRLWPILLQHLTQKLYLRLSL